MVLQTAGWNVSEVTESQIQFQREINKDLVMSVRNDNENASFFS